METASGPLTLMIPMPDSERAVEIAAIVVDDTSLIIYKNGPQLQPWPNRQSETASLQSIDPIYGPQPYYQYLLPLRPERP